MSDTSLQVMTYNEIKALAETVAQSRLFPAFGNKEQAFVLMMVAQAEGCHPITATQRYDIITGKPAKKTDAMLADFQRRGGKVEWVELTDKACEGEFSSPGLSKPVRVRWTIEQAQAAKLTGKDNWKNYPRAMLRARVVSEGIRVSDPGVVAGLYSPEEVADFSPAPSTSAQPAAQAQPAKEAAPVIDVQPVDAAQEEDPKVKAAKVRALVIAIKEAGVSEDLRKEWMSTKLGKPVESSKDLTIIELDQLTAAARAQP